MSIISFPSQPGIASIQWVPPARTQINRSQWSGKRRGTRLPFAGFWKAQVGLPSIISEADFLIWRDFLMATEGQANSFRVVAVESAQNSQVAVRVNGAGQTGLSLATDGWTGSGVALKKGQLITIGDQLIGVAADATISTGAATLSLSRRLRVPTTDNDLIEVRLPTALMAMSTDETPWSVDPGTIYGLSFGCEEVW